MEPVTRFELATNAGGMMWDFAAETRPTARKEYRCMASDWIANLDERDFDPEDLATIQKARSEGNKILPGTRYVKVSGKWEGDMHTFRAREDLDAICKKMDLYNE